MEIKNKILYIYTETTMHAGTGAGLGAVDLPIQREKHTNYPIIQSSGVKGAMRNAVEVEIMKGAVTDAQIKAAEDDIKSVFGGSGEAGDDHAGAVSPSDARILLFPVRALNGVFVWVTSWNVLARFAQETGIHAPIPDDKEQGVYVSSRDILIDENKIMLEEFAYDDVLVDSTATDWASYLADNALPDSYSYWKKRLKTHLVILPETEFRDFVAYSTDIVTRIHLDNTTKTVLKGQLFTQELLPADCLFYSSVRMTNSRDKNYTLAQVFEKVSNTLGKTLQIGADETVGRGRVRLNWQEV